VVKILVVGSGGREHALCWSIAASPLADEVLCAPGNAGIANDARCIPVNVDDIEGIVQLAKDEEVDFVVVGPETALVSGLVDQLDDAGIKAFGPTAAAAQLEGSKSFMKNLCTSYDIPTAAYGSFTDAVAARAYITSQGAPIVIKADGLTAGKGVTVAKSVDEAYAAVDEAVIDGQFGGAGRAIVIEEFLVGEEVSFFVFCDGKTVLPLASAQDHKTVFDGDKGPNTGGMGAYSPAPIMTEVLAEDIMVRIIRPTVAAMAETGTPYKGVLYAGIIVTEDGPKLLEYNVRFGDPECQVLCMRLMSDLLPALIATHDGVLDKIHLRWRKDAALTVIMATKGYPKAYETGSSIGGIEEATAIGAGDVVIFHAGTSLSESGQLIANGGRVLNVTALTGTIERAQALAYKAIDLIDWPEGFCRRDIGWRAIKSDTG
jgi:phosphoribosylamine--glycine ligase